MNDEFGLSGGVKFYLPNLQYIVEFSVDLEKCFEALGNVWSKIDHSEIEKIVTSAIKIYYFKTHYKKLLAHRRDVPPMEYLNIVSSMIRVPRLVRDLCREFCRPMYLQDCIFIPDIIYNRLDNKSIYQMFEDIDVLALNRWNHVWEKLKLELFEIKDEAIKSVPLSFFYPETSTVYSVSQLEDWRIDAFGVLRHLVWNGPLPSVDQSEKYCYDPTEIYNSVIDGRFAGFHPCFLYRVESIKGRYAYLHSDSRFPTTGLHSNTPPRSGTKKKIKSSSDSIMEIT